MEVLSRAPDRIKHGCCLLSSKIVAQVLVIVFAAISAQGEQPVVEPQETLSPYIVFVAEKDSCARCGPGENHYRTDPLRQGQELEVYVETEDGWLGVRPPTNAFCWMPAEAVEMSDDGTTARVLEDKTVAWIGTQLGQAKRYRWQVRLDSGEEVFVLGQNERSDKDGAKIWLRIAPPSGEFRWVHQSAVVESAEKLAQHIAHSATPTGPTPSGPTPLGATPSGPESKPSANAITENNQPKPIQQLPDSIAQADELVPIERPQAAEAPASPSVGAVVQSSGELIDAENGSQRSKLRPVDSMPELAAAPQTRQPLRPEPNAGPRLSADQAIKFLRGVDAEDFEDRGAVIGSGLKRDRQPSAAQVDPAGYTDDDQTSSILSADRLETMPPSSGASAAASAIAEPLKKMSQVVANFISPPRLVEINSTQPNSFQQYSAADKRWMVGSGGRGMAATQLAPLNPTTIQPTQTENQIPSLVAAQQSAASQSPGRVVSIAQISRVEDAVAGASVDTIAQVLSKLMVERASADEIAPVIRRAETLLASGDVSQASRTRELLDQASKYRNLAARRDGATILQSVALASDTAAQIMPIGEGSPARSTSSIHLAGGAAETAQVGSSLPLNTNPLVPAAGTDRSDVNPNSGEPAGGTAQGYLVQVYSSRPNSPPFALTDDAGLTVAYVTPYPGVNLRPHLNSRVAVRGAEKMLSGMSTPHILVEKAIRR